MVTLGVAIDGNINGNNAGTFDSEGGTIEDIVTDSPGRVKTGSAFGNLLVGTAFDGRAFDAGSPNDGNAGLPTLMARLAIETGGKEMEDCTRFCKLTDGKAT